jgi:hypothetical protein
MAQQLSGINAVFYYSTMFFEGVIDSPLLGTTIVGGVNVAATYFALRLMENANRRTLILWSAGGMFVSSVALVLCLLGYFNKLATLLFVLAYVTFFEIGLGPMSVYHVQAVASIGVHNHDLTLSLHHSCLTDPGLLLRRCLKQNMLQQQVSPMQLTKPLVTSFHFSIRFMN